MGHVTLFRIAAPALALIASLAVLPRIAVGAATKFHSRFTGDFSTELCGLTVDVHIIDTDNFFLNPDGSFKDTYSIQQTFTNPANGKSVTVTGAGQAVGTGAIVDEQANTVTFVVSYKGLPEKIQAKNGPVLLRDAGIITFTDVFDLTTGDFISETINVNKGPHPEADSDFTLFCQVITEALS
jgi:hypothetical protein